MKENFEHNPAECQCKAHWLPNGGVPDLRNTGAQNSWAKWGCTPGDSYIMMHSIYDRLEPWTGVIAIDHRRPVSPTFAAATLRVLCGHTLTSFESATRHANIGTHSRNATQLNGRLEEGLVLGVVGWLVGKHMGSCQNQRNFRHTRTQQLRNTKPNGIIYDLVCNVGGFFCLTITYKRLCDGETHINITHFSNWVVSGSLVSNRWNRFHTLCFLNCIFEIFFFSWTKRHDTH